MRMGAEIVSCGPVARAPKKFGSWAVEQSTGVLYVLARHAVFPANPSSPS